jgi:iron complex outermembrane receptor protein
LNRDRLAPLLPAAFLGCLPLPAEGIPQAKDLPPWAVVEVTAPEPRDPLVTALDPRHPHQPVPAEDGAEILRTVPGFATVRKGGTGGDPVLRGMAGSRLGIRVDDEETPGGCGGRMDPPTAYVFPESFDRILVVKGPQTVRYGPGNSAGTVRFLRAPRDRDLPWAASGGWMTGSRGRQDRVLDLQAGTRTFYGRAGGIRSGSGDYRGGDGHAVPSRYDRWSRFGALGWTPGDQTRLELQGTRSDGRAAYADRGMDGVRFLRRNLGVLFETGFPGSGVERLECQAYVNAVDHVMDNGSLRAFTPSPAAPEPMASNPGRTTRGARLALTLAEGEGGRWVVGADCTRSCHTIRRSARQASMPLEQLPRVTDATLEWAGLFGEWTRSCPGGHRLTAGVREDRWQAEDQRVHLARGRGPAIPNPTAGARRDQLLTGGFARWERAFPSGTVLLAGLGYAERAPDYWELFAVAGEALSSAFHTRPERTIQADLGAALQLGDARLSLTGFHGWVEDFILIQSTAARNIRARTRGLEAALAAPLAGGLRLDGSLAWAWGENQTDGLPLAQMPPAEARLGLIWETAAWSAGAMTRLVAAQDRFAPGQGSIAGRDLGRTPGFGVFSLNAGWRSGGSRGLRVTAGIDNLFDRSYAEALSHPASLPAGAAPSGLRVPEPGRTLWVKVGVMLRGH